MFRDLKEYQEIAKIYADKVSKPENLEERVRGGGMKTSGVPAPKPVTVPQKGAGGGSGNPTNTRGTGSGAVKFEKPQGSAQGRTRRPEPQSKPVIKKPMPTTAEIRAANPGRVGGGTAGGSTDSGGTAQMKNSTTFTKQGKQRTKAQMMAAARIAAQKSSPMDRKLTGRERAQQSARDRIAAKKAEAQKF